MFFFLRNSSKRTRLCCCFFFLKVRATMRFPSKQPSPQGAFPWLFPHHLQSQEKALWGRDCLPNKTLSCIWVAIPVRVSCTCRLSYFTFVCLWCGRTDGRSGEREYETWLPKFLGSIDYQIFLPMVLRFARERAPLIIKVNYNYHNKISQNPLRIFF